MKIAFLKRDDVVINKTELDNNVRSMIDMCTDRYIKTIVAEVVGKLLRVELKLEGGGYDFAINKFLKNFKLAIYEGVDDKLRRLDNKEEELIELINREKYNIRRCVDGQVEEALQEKVNDNSFIKSIVSAINNNQVNK